MMTKDDWIGRQLANFRIERFIGQGGMARVYYGWDVKLNRPVAIKMLDVHHQDDVLFAERFLQEAQAVAAFRHEHIIQIYYADDQDGFYYFVMEYVDGLDLGALLSQYAAEGTLLNHDDVLRIGRAIAAALDAAHEHGVVHRDVKPANVIVAGDERIILTDFGLVLHLRRGSLGQVFGSSHYVAPEQARNSAGAVPQSDLYSLAVILYEMLTGTVPFDDPSPTTVALQHVNQPPPHPREVNPNLGMATENVLLKGLSKLPEERYPTGEALMDALEQALQVDGPAAMELGDGSPLARSVSRISVSERVARHLEISEGPSPSQDAADASPLPAADALLGQQLDEYRVETLLGRGGMARVYLGFDTNLERHVAIKVIDNPFEAGSDDVTRFQREAQTIAQLEHPNIVRVYRYGEAEGLFYIVMQRVEGGDLESALSGKRTGSTGMPPVEVSRIIRQICQALDYAHERGVIHRDVKPANIMLNEEGQAILTDFGLALLTELGTRGEIFGSPAYISPEQAVSSANVVPQSDLYAVGVILYEIFTGQLPFDAEGPLDVALQHLSEMPRPPRELCPEISLELEAVILRALAKEPEERYQSGAELAAALDRALQIAPAETRIASPVEPLTSVRTPGPLGAVEIAPFENDLPPVPAVVASLTPQQAEPVSDSLPPIPAAVVESGSPSTVFSRLSEDRRLFIFAGIGIGVVITLILAVIVVAILMMTG